MDVLYVHWLQYKRELICKASGVEFIPAEKLRQIYPEAASSSTSADQQNEGNKQCASESEVAEDAAGITNSAAVVKANQYAVGTDDGTTNGEGDIFPMESRVVEAGNGKLDADGDGDALPTVSKAVVDNTASRKGTEISLLRLRLGDGTATLVATRLSVIIACERCTSREEIDLIPGQLFTATCSRCHSNQLLQLNTEIAHSMSSVIGFVNLEGCQPVDVVLTTSQFLLGCLECSHEATIDVSFLLLLLLLLLLVLSGSKL